MKAVSLGVALAVVCGLAGCGGASYDVSTDKAAVRDVISSAWKAESADDEDTACLYFTAAFIREQNRIWEKGTPGASQSGTRCASGSHPYLMLTSARRGPGTERVRFAWTRVSREGRTATVHPILPGQTGCLNEDCRVVVSLVIHLVGTKGGGWLIDDLEASACEVGGGCVPLADRTDF
jgi:hypothetical protein